MNNNNGKENNEKKINNPIPIANANYTDSELLLLNNTKNSQFNKPSTSDKNQNLTVKEMIDNLKKIIDTNSVTKLFIESSRDLLNESQNNVSPLNKNVDKNIPNRERLTKLSNLCKAYDIDDESDNNLSSQESNNHSNNNSVTNSNIRFNKNRSINAMKQCQGAESVEIDLYPLTDSYLSKILVIDKDQDISELIDNCNFTLPKELNLEEALKCLIKENLNLRLYSKDIELELKDLISTNEMLE
eukprot:jgi/Orpsp1_1/1177132/evm.model.c7180000060306.2